MAHESEFQDWWMHYPRKVGRLAALKAYEKARKVASQDELLKGVAQYVKYKPGYADFAHPATWLTQGRWMDEWDAPPKPLHAAPFVDWYDECQRLHGRRCNGQQGHATQMYIDRHNEAS